MSIEREKSKKLRVLVDTNVLIKGMLDIHKQNESEEKEIINLLLTNKITPLVTATLLEEYMEVAKRMINKDFASKIRYLIVDVFKTAFISEEACEIFEPQFKGKIPDEDLLHFLTCIVGGADYLVSENREFLAMAENKGFKCVTPNKFLKEIKS